METPQHTVKPDTLRRDQPDVVTLVVGAANFSTSAVGTGITVTATA